MRFEKSHYPSKMKICSSDHIVQLWYKVAIWYIFATCRLCRFLHSSFSMLEKQSHCIQTCKQDACLCILSVMQQQWNITISSSSGCWHLRPYWHTAPLRTKGSAVAEETWQEHHHGSDEAHLSNVISDLYVSRQKHFHGWLQALIVHRLIRSQSARSLIIYFPLENAQPSLTCLIKMWRQTKPGSLSLSDSEVKNNFEGLAMVCNQ